MNIAVISKNNELKAFLLDIIDLPSCDLDFLEFDLNQHISISKHYDVILIDVDLKDQSLVSLLIFKIRMSFGWGPYLVAVSSDKRAGRQGLIRTINSGADDFLEDVYNINEVLTKISAITRRRYFEIAQSDGNGNYAVKVREKTVLVNGDAVKLNDKEFELFLFFYGNTNAIFDRQSIYNYIWSDAKQQSTRTLDTHISRIRKRLKLDGSYGLRIKPVYGVGYVMESGVH